MTQITDKEYKDLLSQEFKEIDINHDNYLSQEELFDFLDKKVF